MMPLDVPLSCTCGAVTGVVRGVTWANAQRLSCMCDDCQAYAHYLGRAHEILDAHGGTDLSYATQKRIELLTGSEQLRAVRLYPTGLLRVYAGCCRTPVAHVPSAKLAFVGIVHSFMQRGPDGETRDAMLGPLVHRLQGRYCRGEMPAGAHRGTPVALQAKATVRVLWDSVRGQHRPSAFHHARSNEPTVTPTVLSPAELDGLRGGHAAGAELPGGRRAPLGCS
ncbi:MAG TPA: DUF6151 family protein [Polyangiaceae bacterium]|nr:DUF6151 family protein [Polyangiaceae bacterium]